jgi:hypothetical protein
LSGTGTSATSSSRIDARHAATDRCIGAVDVGRLAVRTATILSAATLRALLLAMRLSVVVVPFALALRAMSGASPES